MTMLRRTLRRFLPRRLTDVLRILRYSDFELVAGPLTYNQDWLAVAHKTRDFLDEPHFRESYELGRSTGSWGATEPLWRAYINCWAAGHAKNLDRDFVECGTYKGGGAIMVVHYVSFQTLTKTFYLLDTFTGPAVQYLSAEEMSLGRQATSYADCYATVCQTFSRYGNVAVVQGAVPDTLQRVTSEKISYLHLDLNSALPERAAAEFFWERLVSGGIMLSDDYGWTIHHQQKRTLDEFAARRGVGVLPLPTGQGLIFKP